MFSLLYWGVIGLFLLYVWLIPEKPKLAVYAQGADSEEHDKQRSGTKRKKRNKGASDDKKEDETSIENKLNAAVTAVMIRALACDYAKQSGLMQQCSQAQKVELDNDSTSLEVFVLNGEHTTCEISDCNMGLVQISAKHFAAYQLYITQEGEREPWTPKAKTITDWRKVKLPISIEKASHNGWRKLKITQNNGQVDTWRQPIKQNPMRKKSRQQKVTK